MVLTGLALAIGCIPGFGMAAGPLVHAADRIKNRLNAKQETKRNLHIYADSINKVLGRPEGTPVTEKDFFAASKGDALQHVYNAPLVKEAEENRSSAMISVAATVAGSFGGAGVAIGVEKATTAMKVVSNGVQVAKQIAGGIGGGMVAGLLARDTLDTQELLEALEKGLEDADKKGVSRTTVVNPDILFLIRASQDKFLSKQISQRFKAPLHKLSDEQFRTIVGENLPLMEAVKKEALAIVDGSRHIRDIGAFDADIQGAVDQQKISHVERVNLQRAAAQQVAPAGQTTAANDGSFAGRLGRQQVAPAGQSVAANNDSFVSRVNASQSVRGLA